MTHFRKLWIVIADGEHARILTPAGGGALREERALDSVSAHLRSSDLGSDQPGAAFHSDSTAHHSFAPRHDPHDLAKAKFAGTLAAELDAAAAEGAFEDLLLVAPAHSHAAILEALNPATAARVIGRLEKDLVKSPALALWAQLEAFVRPVHLMGLKGG